RRPRADAPIDNADPAVAPFDQRQPRRGDAMKRLLALIATTAVGVGIAFSPAVATATTDEPVPITGGIETGLPPPNGPIIHVLAPGPTEYGFMGAAVVPNTITNFNGFSALAYLNGTATHAEGNTYAIGLSDLRLFHASYRTAARSPRRGTFSL